MSEQKDIETTINEDITSGVNNDAANNATNDINNDINDTSPISEELIMEKLKIQGALKGGANWFYWIAGLSLINTIIFIFGGNWSFVIGLSITQLADALSYGLYEVVSLNAANIIRVFSIAFDVVIAGLFIFFGYFANKRHNWSFIVGMILYALDALISLVFKDFISIGFHLLALYYIFNGLKANKRLVEIEKGMQ